ncbi:integrase core domain-containing protein [Streptomyces sp. WZ-12]|uniref:integrase core domain-containing protein n=1 Tax=Streptomyces sp. WZ-12 TaxID=3030210 RepID=UPI00406C8302
MLPGNGHGRFGGRPDGKGPAQQAPRCPTDPTGSLRRELLDSCGPFETLTVAQASIEEWVHAYNYRRPHQALAHGDADLQVPPRARALGATDSPGAVRAASRAGPHPAA